MANSQLYIIREYKEIIQNHKEIIIQHQKDVPMILQNAVRNSWISLSSLYRSMALTGSDWNWFTASTYFLSPNFLKSVSLASISFIKSSVSHSSAILKNSKQLFLIQQSLCKQKHNARILQFTKNCNTCVM